MRNVQHRNPATRQVTTQLARTAVHHVRQQVGPHTGKIEQRVALGGGAISGDRQAVALAAQQKLQQLPLDAVRVVLKTLVKAGALHAGIGLQRHQPRHIGADRTGTGIGALLKNPQAATMGRQLLHVKDLHAAGLQHALHTVQGQVGIVLVVSGVKLVAAHHGQQMRELEAGNTRGLEQQGKSGHKIIDVRHMGQHVVGHHQIGLAALHDQLLRQFDAKEALFNADPPGPRRRRSECRRFDAITGDTCITHVLQQVAVVGGHLDQHAAGAQRKALQRLVHKVARVRQPGTGDRAEVAIVFREQGFATSVIFGLHQPAAGADQQAQRIPDLGCVQSRGVEVGIGRWCAAQIKKGQLQRRSAMATFHARVPCIQTCKPGSAASRADNRVTGRGQAIASCGSCGCSPSSECGA